MRAVVPVAVGDTTINVRELTFAEVRAWMVEAETSGSQDPLHALALEDCGIDDLARMSDASVITIEKFAPSEIAELIATAKKVNPHFFRMRAALFGVARMMLAEAEALASTAPPASS